MCIYVCILCISVCACGQGITVPKKLSHSLLSALLRPGSVAFPDSALISHLYPLSWCSRPCPSHILLATLQGSRWRSAASSSLPKRLFCIRGRKTRRACPRGAQVGLRPTVTGVKTWPLISLPAQSCLPTSLRVALVASP